jgi:hypothetical protein
VAECRVPCSCIGARRMSSLSDRHCPDAGTQQSAIRAFVVIFLILESAQPMHLRNPVRSGRPALRY